jgi:hypothetical protein
MKKLLLVLLCLPILTLAQVGAGGEEDRSYYYPSEESVSDGGAYYDGGITHVVPFAYNGHNYPDSIYAFDNSFGLQIFGSLTYDNSEKIQSVFLDAMFFQINLDYTYSANKVETFSIIEGVEGMHHTFFYDASDNLIEKQTTVVPSGEQYKKTFTYSNGKLIQLDYFLLPNTTTPIQTDVLTYNPPNQLQSIELSNGVKFEYGYNSTTNFCESVVLFYNNNYTDTVITREYDSNGNMIRTSIKEFDLSTSPPTLDEYRTMTYTYDSYNRNIKEEYWDNNQLTGVFVDYIYFTPPTGIQEQTTNKELLKVTDLLGRETKQTNQPLFYIYDDGTVEKRIVIE